MSGADDSSSTHTPPPIKVVVIEPVVVEPVFVAPPQVPFRDQPSQQVQQLTETSLESLQQVAANTEDLFNSGIRSAVRSIAEISNVAQRGAEEGRSVASHLYDEGKNYVDVGIAHYRAAEDQVFDALKHGIEWGIVNPYISYPAAALGVLLTLPVTRKLIVRNTIGSLRNPESVREGAEGSVLNLRTKLDDYAAEAKKLSERAAIAEREMKEGQRKMSATRLELQRLAKTVGKAESTADRVLRDLRIIKRLEKVSELRAEAAKQLALFRAQRTALERQAYSIASQDV